jgi:ParB-like nuclease domain
VIDPDFEIDVTEPKPHELTAHPHAAMFPMSLDDELAELTADIEKHGQREPIRLYEGQILDGRNRYEACLRIGIEPKTVQYEGDDPAAFVISANLYRRHLTPAQKQEVVEKLLAAKPERSDRAIGKLARVDHKTVGTRRAELEARGEIPHVEKRADTKGRSYPVHREGTSASAPVATPDVIGSKADREARKASKAIIAFLGVLHEGDIYRRLDELLRMLGHEKKRIAELTKIQREVLARGFLALLDIPPDDLRPIVGVPVFEGALLASKASEIAPEIKSEEECADGLHTL